MTKIYPLQDIIKSSTTSSPTKEEVVTILETEEIPNSTGIKLFKMPTTWNQYKFIMLIFLSLLWFGGAIINGESIQKSQWICNDANQCTELSTSESFTNNSNISSVKFKNQNICRLSCGDYGSLWPQPTIKPVLSHDRSYFDPNNVRFNVVAPNGETSQYISDVNRIFIQNIIRECTRSCKLRSGKEVFVKITINSTITTLNWDTDESYKIVITESDIAVFIDIKAFSIFGARHALETVSQLITANVGNGLVLIAGARIEDKPKFQHRGLLLDTARNYIPIRNIKSTLDGMATCKLNILHWHATDSHSFPIEIPKVPELQKYGAYSDKDIYTKNDIKYIIKYARLRGIRVLIELDAPSHAGNGWQWGPMAGLGNLSLCINQQPWRKYCIQPPCGQLNPINDNVYIILKKIFEEIAAYLPTEDIMHMGGDEVFLGCWNSTEEILEKLKERGMDTSTTSFLKLWSEFHMKNLNIWDEIKMKKSPVILWSSHLTEPDVIEQYLPSDRYIIQTWVESTLPLNNQLIEKGYRIIVSTKDAWYLDHGFWGVTKYYNWKKVYENRLTAHQSVLGGEACMWTEFVDENTLDGRIWPRTGAVAERLWSDPNTNAAASESRFYRFRDRLISRGIKPDAIIPKWCTLHEGQCV